MQSVPITTNVVYSNPAHGEVYSVQHCGIKFVSDLRQVGCFPISSTNKTDHRDIAEILLKVAILIVIENIFVIIMIVLVTIDLIECILFSFKLHQDICVNLNKNLCN